MRNLGVDENTVAAYWMAEGICYLKYCSPVQSSALTRQQQQQDLSKVDRRAVAAMTSTYDGGKEFKEIFSCLGLEPGLGQRRFRLAQRTGHVHAPGQWTTPTTRRQDLEGAAMPH